VGCNNFLRACFVLAVAACLVAIGLSAGGGNGRSLSVAACDGDDGTGRMKKADALSRPEGHGKKGRLSLLSSLLLPTIPFPPLFSPCATSNRSRSDQISRCHCSLPVTVIIYARLCSVGQLVARARRTLLNITARSGLASHVNFLSPSTTTKSKSFSKDTGGARKPCCFLFVHARAVAIRESH
jgi:hypothetical protein